MTSYCLYNILHEITVSKRCIWDAAVSPYRIFSAEFGCESQTFMTHAVHYIGIREPLVVQSFSHSSFACYSHFRIFSVRCPIIRAGLSGVLLALTSYWWIFGCPISAPPLGPVINAFHNLLSFFLLKYSSVQFVQVVQEVFMHLFLKWDMPKMTETEG